MGKNKFSSRAIGKIQDWWNNITFKNNAKATYNVFFSRTYISNGMGKGISLKQKYRILMAGK